MNKYFVAAFFTITCNWSFSTDIKLKDSGSICTQQISLNGNNWKIAVDSNNLGREKEWFKAPPLSVSKETPVPWVIQDIFHDYHGVAWYWREFDTPVNLHKNGRYLLNFNEIDYLAEVWLNGRFVGNHEGGENSF